MKPISLKIKGLNSFENTQEIDFEKLTERGIFGIFGPTGSGKSTVLDGITLSLYGEVARKSSNFINVNCNDSHVSYQFQISEKEVKTYRVEREFRRDQKSGNVRSKGARIISIEGNTERILEEGAKNVTEKCQEILGLKLEDFTRTVVLPQGKFSEFLKLEGKDRRNMLERLFGLQKYGDDLSFKLNLKNKEEKRKFDELNGQLKGYEGINEEILETKILLMKELENNYKKTKKEYDDLEKKYNYEKELWKLQLELEEKYRELEILKKRENEIKDCEKRVKLAEGALKVKPYIDNFQSISEQIKSIKDELSNLNIRISLIRKNKNEVEMLLNKARDRKDKELPELKVKEQKIKDAMDEQRLLEKLKQEKNSLENHIKSLKEKLNNNVNHMIINENYTDNLLNKIKSKENLMETLKISEEYKRKINEGIIILANYENRMIHRDELVENIKNCQKNIKTAAYKDEILLKDINEKENTLRHYETRLNTLIKTCPGDENTLLSFQQNLSYLKTKWDKYDEYINLLDKNKDMLENLEKDLKHITSIKSKMKYNTEELEKKIYQFEKENMAIMLIHNLQEGDLCPVCGSVYRQKKEIREIDKENLEKLKFHFIEQKSKMEELTKKAIEIQTNIVSERKNTEENERKIKELGEDFKSTPTKVLEDKFYKLKQDLYKFNEEKNLLEEEIKKLKDKKNSLDINHNREATIQIQEKTQLIKLQQDLELEEEKIKLLEGQLSSLKTELSAEDFKNKANEIMERQKRISKLESEIKEMRKTLEIKQSERDKIRSYITVLKEKLSEKQTRAQEMDKSIIEKEQNIKNKVGEIGDLTYFSKKVYTLIEKIKSEYIKTEKAAREIGTEYDDLNNKIILDQSKLVNLNERNIIEEKNLKNVLEEQGFEDIYKVEKFFMNKLEMEKFNKEIQEYKNSIAKIKGAIENIYKNMEGRTLTKEQWDKTQNDKNEKSYELNKLYENKITLNKEVASINTKLSELKKLLSEKKKMEHKLGLLGDLEKLFKGKKFVEFIAANQLKYISLEADKKLREITCGNYGLEVDEDGKFFIRDYKNGGKERDASTLSGGETFVTSLALALALSSQIQLKGRSPLELFFLDEGFGTLDDNLLEIVMDSLEKIHNDKLSIGVISHLEIIKERMPVKLIVTATESGMGGSKVKIEKN
ncbi:AAA family ATPase [Clostridium sp. BJN0013]|uniref:AAA family ATPase n=1 Tax=Clostridium sp. BJN0013 TaxID=3236840 RepID=UPI0034C67EB1